MIVDRGILRLQLDGALQMLHRIFILADAIIGPAERVHDIAIIWPLLDRAADHLHAIVEIDALIDP